MKRILAVLCALLLTFSFDGHAAEGKSKKKSAKASHNVSRNVTASKQKSSKQATRKKAVESTAKAKNDTPRHAALVINADNGKILLNESAYAIRYPASLTKMMTLYLTFEALKSGKLQWNKMLPASSLAAMQPQTNISLQEGDRISVQTAVLALIIRSANDASVVLAEALGGSKENFAYMMTEKARDLGMKNTVFRNPNGLPDKDQHTTAYDMAMLGIALRKDFPEYYSLFKTQQFSYNGRTYKGHNKVLNRLDGVDGIKTGYIGASGFNLVSSIKKDGVNLVGVVLGGRSGAERDNYMVSILKKNYDEQYALLHNGKSATQVADAQEEPKAPTDTGIFSRLASAAPSLITNANAEDEQGDRTTEESVAMQEPSTTPEKPAPLRSNKFNISVTPEIKEASDLKPNTLDHQMASLADKTASLSRNSAAEMSKPWGIQFGAYSDKNAAEKAAEKALGLVSRNLDTAQIAIATEGKEGKAIHRARLGNLTRKEARTACQILQAANSQCFALMVSN